MFLNREKQHIIRKKWCGEMGRAGAVWSNRQKMFSLPSADSQEELLQLGRGDVVFHVPMLA